jgi:hypothetical protein
MYMYVDREIQRKGEGMNKMRNEKIGGIWEEGNIERLAIQTTVAEATA